MANTFKKYTAEGSTAGAVIYTVPANAVGVMIGINAANKSLSSENVSVDIDGVYLIKDALIPTGSALSLLDGKIVLESGNVVKVTSSSNASIDVILSVMEQV